MSDPFGINNYKKTPSEPKQKEVPKKWRGDYQYMYDALQELTTERKRTIKMEPRLYSDRMYTITTKDLCDGLGKDKSYLNETRWAARDTPLRKAMALLVKDLNDINKFLKAKLDKQRSKKPPPKLTKSQKKKSALIEENRDLKNNYNKLLKQGYEDLVQQINYGGEELATRCSDLEEALKKERKKNDQSTQARKQQIKEQTRNIAEIDRLTKLNNILERELAELKRVEHSNRKITEVDVHHPPDDINPDAWGEWLEYKTAMGKKVSPKAAEKQWIGLASLSFEQQAKTIDLSIKNDWHGLFPEKMAGRNLEGTRARTLAEDLTDTSWAD